MKSRMLFVGTHRRAHRGDPVDVAFGIYSFREGQGGVLFSPAGMVETPQPGWIAVHPNGKFLYTANEVGNFDGRNGGGVSAFAIDQETGALSPLNGRDVAPLPCHCEIDGSGRYLVVATYGGGAVHLFSLESDGRIGPETDMHRHRGSSVHPIRQVQPHAHQAALDPANRFVLVPDLGTDQVIVYELDRQRGKLIERPERSVRLAAGSGPRHVAFDLQARFVYLLNEMSATITTFAYEATSATLRELETVDVLPDGFRGFRSGAEINVHPSGRFLYATTRSHGSSGEPAVRGLDSIVWFEIDPIEGKLSPAGRIPSGGEMPRSFAFDSSGDHLFVGNQSSGTIVKFRLNSETGTPIACEETVPIPVPVCLCFCNAG